MKRILYKSFGILIVLVFFACDDFNSSNKYPIQNTHQYSDGHTGHSHSDTNKKNSALDTSQIDKVKDRFSSESRHLWQQPNLALEMFGDLTDKIVADIGAGPEGYFALFLAGRTDAKKILALDIDPKALTFIDDIKKSLDEDAANRLETRLVEGNNPKLGEAEVDAVLISETLIYIEDPIHYLTNLRKSIKSGGKLLIIDFKMKKIPAIFPSVEQRMPLYKMEKLVEKAGFKRLASDDMSLPFHYMVLCENP